MDCYGFPARFSYKGKACCLVALTADLVEDAIRSNPNRLTSIQYGDGTIEQVRIGELTSSKSF